MVDLVLNDGRVTRIASWAGEEDSVIGLLLVSSLLAPICQRGVLRVHDCDH